MLRYASGMSKNGESSRSAGSPLVPSRIDQIVQQIDNGQPKRRRGLSVLEKYQICAKRIESKGNQAMKLDEFARFFPGIFQYY